MAPIHLRALDCLGRRIEGMPVIIKGFELEDEPSDEFVSQTSAITDTVLCVPNTRDRRDFPKPVDASDYTFFHITFCTNRYFDVGTVPWTKVCADVRLPGRVQHLITLTFGPDNLSYELQHTSTPLFHIFDELDGASKNWAGFTVKTPQTDDDGVDRAQTSAGGPSGYIRSPSPLSLYGNEYDMETDSDEWSPLLSSSVQKRKATFSEELLPPNKRLR